jgi:hypothetical protein
LSLTTRFAPIGRTGNSHLQPYAMIWQSTTLPAELDATIRKRALSAKRSAFARRFHALAPGHAAQEKFAAVQMIDVHRPTTDGRELVLTRFTEPAPELSLPLNKLELELPAQPPRKITAAPASTIPL